MAFRGRRATKNQMKHAFVVVLGGGDAGLSSVFCSLFDHLGRCADGLKCHLGDGWLLQTAAAAMAELVFIARAAGARLVAAELVGIVERLPAHDIR